MVIDNTIKPLNLFLLPKKNKNIQYLSSNLKQIMLKVNYFYIICRWNHI